MLTGMLHQPSDPFTYTTTGRVKDENPGMHELTCARSAFLIRIRE